jgi:hypothetical protein
VPGLVLVGNATATLNGIHVALPGYLPFSPGNAIPFGGPQTLVQMYHDQARQADGTWTSCSASGSN